MSMVETNPSILFGGTWEQIEDKFLLSAGSIYESGTTGGSVSHNHVTGNCSLTIEQMPQHNHQLIKNVPYGMPYNDTEELPMGAGGPIRYQESYSPFLVGHTGGNQPHNHGNTGNSDNMPPYLVVYVWKRVA